MSEMVIKFEVAGKEINISESATPEDVVDELTKEVLTALITYPGEEFELKGIVRPSTATKAICAIFNKRSLDNGDIEGFKQIVTGKVKGVVLQTYDSELQEIEGIIKSLTDSASRVKIINQL